MKLRRLFSLTGTSFRQQLVITFTVGIVLSAVIASFAIITLSSRAERDRLTEQGLQTTATFASQSTLALLYRSPDNAHDFAEATLTYPDVVAVAIYDLEPQPLLSLGQDIQLPDMSLISTEASELIWETSKAWYFAAPVYARQEASTEQESPFVIRPAGNELVGHVAVVLSKASLTAQEAAILRTNLFVSGTLAAALLLVLLAITTRMTTPLRKLAATMRRAEQGEQEVRAEVRGPRDIIDMGAAFNTMMSVLEARGAELKRAHDELEQRVEERTADLAKANTELKEEVAERKRVQHALVQAKDAADRANQAKSLFLSNMSHELRTPLNAIMGFTQLLQEDEDAPPTDMQQDCYKQILTAADHLLQLINEVLDLARIESGRLTVSIQSVAIDELLNETLSLIQPLAEKHSIRVLDHRGDLAGVLVQGDPTRLKEVLLNLLSNAIKYNREQGSVTLQVAQDRGMLRLHVSDTGIGLSQEEQEQLFEPFTRLDSHGHIEGTGIGLTIAKRLVELMGGEIGLTSKVGEGTTFWFTIPCTESRQQRVPEVQTWATDTELEERLRDARILIVEDNPANQALLDRMLTRLGTHVELASNGADAVAMWESEDYDLVLMDIRMPKMDGLQATRAIRGLERPGKHTPIVALTAQAMKGDREKCLAAGMNDYVEKPIMTERLVAVLRTWLFKTSPTPGDNGSSSRGTVRFRAPSS